MQRPPRTTPSIFPDTFDGLLAKAKTLTRECPDKREWRCVLGFVDYKLVPEGGAIQEEVIDAFLLWLGELRARLAAGGECGEDLEGATAEDLARLIRLVAERLEAAGE